MMDVSRQLSFTREKVIELGNIMSGILCLCPALEEEVGLKDFLLEYKEQYTKTLDRLQKPKLSIASLGTTSSGKSTILNALIGREIAPIDASEMSGGTLTILNSSINEVEVEAENDKGIFSRIYHDLSDIEINHNIKEVMKEYHQIRKERETKAPRVTVKTQILPCIDKDLIKLAKEIDLEFVDLPGLKNENDITNRKIIKKQVGKSLSIVSLDYTKTDDSNRGELLRQLLEVVSFLEDRTDLIIFLLNKVDQRDTRNDGKISEKIALLKNEIKGVLGSNIDIEIVPFCGQLLYYSQCAWGTSSLNETPSTTDAKRLELIRCLFENCGDARAKIKNENPEFYDWLYELERKVDKGQLETEELRKLLSFVRDWSGGSKVWNIIKNRIEFSFPEIVLTPAVLDLVNTQTVLSEEIKTSVKNFRKDSESEIAEELSRLNHTTDKILKEIKSLGSSFQDFVDTTVEIFNKGEGSYNKAFKSGLDYQSEQESEGYNLNLNSLFSAVDEVKADLTSKIVYPLDKALKSYSEKNKEILVTALEEVITSPIAKELSIALDNYYALRTMPSIEVDEQHDSLIRFKIDKSINNSKEISLEVERKIRYLFNTISESLSARADLLIESKSSQIEKLLQELIEEQHAKANKRCQELYTEVLPQLGIENIIAAKSQFFLSKKANLPDNIFRMPEPSITDDSEAKTIEQREEEYRRTWYVLWLRKVKVEVVSYEEVNTHYRVVSAPNESELIKVCTEGINSAENQMWQILKDWMKVALSESNISFSDNVNDASKSVIISLNRQLERLKNNLLQDLKILESVDTEVIQLDEQLNLIKTSAQTLF